MELKIWSKTLLNVYGCLYKLTNAIDKLVLEFGLNSGRYYGFDKTFNDTQKIIELTDRKVTLINLKVLINKILVKMDDVLCKILTLKYIDKMPNETIIKVLNLSRRTYFRKLTQAINSFSNLLIVNGFNKDTAFNFLGEESWIIDVYNDILKKELSKQNEGEVSKISILNMAVKDYKLIRKNNYMA